MGLNPGYFLKYFIIYHNKKSHIRGPHQKSSGKKQTNMSPLSAATTIILTLVNQIKFLPKIEHRSISWASEEAHKLGK